MNSSQKKSITLFSNNYWTLYKFREDVVNYFLNKNYKINLIGKFDGFEQKFSNTNITKYNLNIDERGYNIFKEIILFFKIFTLYSNLSSKIYFHYTIKPNIYGSLCARFLNYRYVSFITGLGKIFIKSNFFFRNIIIFIYKSSLKKADEVWFANKYDQKEFIDNKIILKSQKIKIVPGCGVSSSLSLTDTRNYNKKNILMIARLQVEKGVREYLELAQRYYKSGYTFTLVGNYNPKDPSRISHDKLNKLINNKIIHYIPFSSDVTSLYDSADCFILPSYREGISTVLLEAAIRKVPIITTRSPGCIDVIPDESFGLLCNKADFDSLHNAFIRYVNIPSDDLISMVSKSYNHVLKNFSRESIIDIYDQKLTEIV